MLTLTGANTYSGRTLIQEGTLVAGTVGAAQAISFALGTGDVFLQGGTLRTPSHRRYPYSASSRLLQTSLYRCPS
jgi:autotransporter-associated beta strand protein